MPQSSDVAAGDDVLASQYVNLRKDVLDPNLGHKHTGLAGEGTALGSPLLPLNTDLVGDGSDGDLVVNAPTTFSELKQFNDLTLNDIVTPGSGKNVIIIFVKGTLTINAAGHLKADGFGAAGGAAGAGNNGADGFAPNSFALPEVLGAGAGQRSVVQGQGLLDAGDDMLIAFGSGGGSSGNGFGGNIWAGGGRGTSLGASAAGGNGGGCILIFADTIVINASGKISANGADGQAISASNNGGGGGGGLVYMAYRTLTNNGTVEALKGLGGVGGINADDGAPGITAEKIIPG